MLMDEMKNETATKNNILAKNAYFSHMWNDYRLNEVSCKGGFSLTHRKSWEWSLIFARTNNGLVSGDGSITIIGMGCTVDIDYFCNK